MCCCWKRFRVVFGRKSTVNIDKIHCYVWLRVALRIEFRVLLTDITCVISMWMLLTLVLHLNAPSVLIKLFHEVYVL